MDPNVSFLLALQHAVAASLRPLTDQLVYTMRSGLVAGLKRKGGLGFLPRQLNKEERFLQSLTRSLKGKTVYEVGSYEGVFATFFARATGPDGSLVIFEPNPACQDLTSVNLKLNGFEFHLVPVGLGTTSASLLLTYPQGEPARSTLDPEIADKIDGERQSKPVHLTVRVEPLDRLVRQRGFRPPDFIKIDAEGTELEVLLGAEQTIRKHRPILYIEMHGASLESKLARQQEVHSLLRSWGYAVEDLYGRDVLGAEEHIEHIFCRYLDSGERSRSHLLRHSGLSERRHVVVEIDRHPQHAHSHRRARTFPQTHAQRQERLRLHAVEEMPMARLA